MFKIIIPLAILLITGCGNTLGNKMAETASCKELKQFSQMTSKELNEVPSIIRPDRKIFIDSYAERNCELFTGKL